TVTFTATDDCGNASSTTATFTIEDTTVPTIDTTNLSDIDIQCGITPDGTLEAWLQNNAGATASDACSGVTWTNDYGIGSNLDCDSGDITVTFRATDECGNFSEVTATYSIIDTVAPVLTVPADVTLECTEDTSPSNTGTATATDDCITPTVTFSDSEVTNCGITKIITRTWTATDACLNTTSEAQIITVVDTTVPTIDTAASDSTVECDGAGNTAELNAWLA
ncbi:hypothetical protein J4050_15185, partial [Winogradskyella sp. DF17]|nr:hypothetical protein [Winogradskyella sp. DF17]